MHGTSNSLAVLAVRIREEHDAAEAAKGAAVVAARQGIEHALAAGSLLLEAKAQVPHGQWLPWLAENCPTVSPRMAQYYMGLARKRPELESKCETVSHLTLREAVQLLDNDDGGEDESGSRGTSDEWFTPAPVLAVARDVLGHFDLDPASCAEAQRNVQATRYFSVADDGLEQAWEGRVWLNPPYSQPLLDQFVTKLIDEVKGQRVTEAILLMANKPIITWYKALRACSAQCLWNARIMFEHLSGSTQSAQYGSAVFYFGDRVEEFARRFAEFGQVVRPDRGLALDDETDDDDTSRDENDDDDEADDSDEWYTPANILDAVRDVLGTIDLDPASCPEAQATVQATRYFTIEDDGLKQEWRGRVWLNGPFSHPLNIRFVNKLIAEVASGRVSKAIMLVNILPSAWLQEAITICSAVCFSRDRLRFTHQTGKIQINNHNLVIFYFGPDVEKFVRRFAEF